MPRTWWWWPYWAWPTLAADPRQLGDVGVGVRVAAAPAHRQQQRIAPAQRPRRPLGLLDAQPAQLDDLGVQVQVAAVVELHPGVTPAGFVDLAGDVVLG